MNEKLSEQTKNKIMNLCKTEIYLNKYIEKVAIILLLITLGILICLYLKIQDSFFLLFIAMDLITSSILIVFMKNLTCPFERIYKNECTCFESTVLGNRIRNGRNKNYYYVITKIDNKSVEIEYKGKTFKNMIIGEKILVISYRNLWGKEKFICFLEKEISE